MSVAEAANRPVKSRRTAKLWLAFLAVIAAGVALAWFGAQSVRDRVVQVQTLQAGSGPFVQAPDGVLIEYEGRLENGTVFDSSAGKGPVPLLASQVIPGFTQGLLKMQKGGRYKLRIPSDLAYGATPPQGGPIPANANLEFDVNVVQVVPNAALMQQGGGAPPGQ
jgi:FKBP-type peptidyl-prolyl cis-trans isomerase FkpA